MKWQTLPAKADSNMLLAASEAGGHVTGHVWAALLAAAPSPWISLDPAAPGHRMPTESDLSPQGAISVWELGKERVVHISGFEHQLDQRRRQVLWIESGSWTHWAPCRSGPEE